MQVGSGEQGIQAILRLRVPDPLKTAWNGYHALQIQATGAHRYFEYLLKAHVNPSGIWTN